MLDFIVPHIDMIFLSLLSTLGLGISLAWALFETKLLDIVPIARNRVFEEISDPLIILDEHLRTVDLNKSAIHVKVNLAKKK